MALIGTLWPGLLVALLTVLAALPLGVESGARFLLPLLPLVAIAWVAIRAPARMPSGVAFAAGLALDVLTHGPLGYWSLVYLAGYLLATTLASSDVPSLGAAWAGLAAVLLGAAAVEWSVHSLYFVEPAALRPRILAAAAALAIAPLVVLLLRLGAAPAARRSLQLERGV
jgi:rod shape-determining protein MreD